jgi:hypothetical protein
MTAPPPKGYTMLPQHDLELSKARRQELEAEAAQYRLARSIPRKRRSRRWAARKVSKLRPGADEFARTRARRDLARLLS